MKSVISKKLLIAMALAVGLAALLSSVIQLASEYRRDVATIHQNLDKVGVTYLESLQDALWQLDVAQIRSNLHTIASALSLNYIAIVSPDTGPIEVGSPPESAGEVRELVIERPKGAPGTSPLGRLIFSASLRPVYNQLGERLVLMFLVNGSKTMFLGLFLVLVMDRLVTGRINRFSEEIQTKDDVRTSPISEDDFRSPILKEQDEIDRLVTSFNQLQSLLSLERTKLADANEELKGKVHQLEIAVREKLEREEQLLTAKREAEAANRAKSNFLANTSHELRTPLTAIIGFIELLKNSDKSAQTVGKFVEVVERNAQQLLHVVSEVLDISGANESFYRLRPEQVDVANIVEDVVANVRSLAEKKGLKIDVRVVKRVGMTSCDPYRVRQVLYNLVGNAIKFTEQGAITIIYSAETRGTDGQCFHSVSVRDTGIGIDSANSERIFDPFTQADESITRQYSGSGLGLAISRRVARVLGGNVVLKNSVVGKGSEFVFTFASDKVESLGAGVSEKPTKSFDENRRHDLDLSEFSIVVIDDNQDNLLLMERILTSRGAHVRTALDGETGIEIALEEIPDLILLDIQMPGLDGYATARQLRSRGFRKPIIAVTAKVMFGERERCLEAGFSEMLAKPFDSESLIRKVRTEYPEYA